MSKRYSLSRWEARNLWLLAHVTIDRTDDEQSALIRLAEWLDATDTSPGGRNWYVNETMNTRMFDVSEASE